MVKLIKRQGISRIYQHDDGRIVWIGACLNRDVYTKPGYYIEAGHPLASKRFSSANRAAIAAFKGE